MICIPAILSNVVLKVVFHFVVPGTLDTFVTDSASIASSIKYHAQYTPSFSPEKFELPKAYIATAESVWDNLIINWNATYDYYEKLNVKQAYYLSMEYLQVCGEICAILSFLTSFRFHVLFVHRFEGKHKSSRAEHC